MAGESNLQTKCKDYASSHHVLTRKIHAEGHRGWTDLVLIFPVTGEAVWVEMKNPNGKGKLGDLQAREHEKIRQQSALVYTCKSLKHFKQIVNFHLNK